MRHLETALKWNCLLVFYFFSFPASATPSQSQVATITAIQGTGFLLSQPGKQEPQKGATLVSYEGQYYSIHEAKVGDHLENENVLRCPPDSKIRLVYDNGDVIEVFPGTSYRVRWNPKQEGSKAQPEVNLHYGRIRSIISSKGPRNSAVIRTRSAIMGVRGTDFIVSEDGHNGSKVSVLRGEVQVNPLNNSKKAFIVPAQSTGTLLKGSSPDGWIAKSYKTTQAEITEIRDLSRIDKARAQPTTPETDQLEKTAVVTALDDIQTKNPSVHAGIQAASISSLEALDLELAQGQIEKAPTKIDLFEVNPNEAEQRDKKSYQKFFKNAQ